MITDSIAERCQDKAYKVGAKGEEDEENKLLHIAALVLHLGDNLVDN